MDRDSGTALSYTIQEALAAIGGMMTILRWYLAAANACHVTHEQILDIQLGLYESLMAQELGGQIRDGRA